MNLQIWNFLANNDFWYLFFSNNYFKNTIPNFALIANK